jgi:SAM-dependent methyltransferase
MTPYARATVASPAAIKRWSHGSRFKAALDLLDLDAAKSLLDFGTGDGLLMEMARDRNPALYIRGLEPHPINRGSAIGRRVGPVYEHFSEVTGKFDRVACLEVLEHIPERLMDRTMAELKQCLAPGGLMVVSVPIEVGPVALGKGIARAALRAAHEASAGDIARAVVYRTDGIQRREKGDIIVSHVGFDHRALRKRIEASGFTIAETAFSPLPIGGALMNSQIHWTMHHATSK